MSWSPVPEPSVAILGPSVAIPAPSRSPPEAVPEPSRSPVPEPFRSRPGAIPSLVPWPSRSCPVASSRTRPVAVPETASGPVPRVNTVSRCRSHGPSADRSSVNGQRPTSAREESRHGRQRGRGHRPTAAAAAGAEIQEQNRAVRVHKHGQSLTSGQSIYWANKPRMAKHLQRL